MLTPIRVTAESDGQIEPRMYSYWSNAWLAGDDAFVFCGRSDGMPLFCKVDLHSGEVTRGNWNLSYLGTTEGWYWDARGWIYLIDGPRLRHVDPFDGEESVVFSIKDTHPGCDLWQAHSSDDGRCHSASVRKIIERGAYPILGTVYVRDGVQTFYPASDTGDVDESAITTDGRYLIIKSTPNDDNLVIDTFTGEQRRILKANGALGHSDCGPDYMVGADRDHEPRAIVRWNLDQPLTIEHRILLGQSPDWSGGDMGHVSIKNGHCIVSDATYIKSVGLNGEGVVNLLEHGMVGSGYDYNVNANLDPSGQVICYMTNNGTERQDVYLVRL